MINDMLPPARRPAQKPKRIEPLEKPAALPLHEQAKAEDPTFQTPEEIAADDNQDKPSPFLPMVIEHSASAAKAFKPSNIFKNSGIKAPGVLKKRRWWPQSRKWQIICGVAIVVLLSGAGAGWVLTHQQTPAVVVHKKKAIVKKVVPPPIIYSTLTGLPVPDASVNQRTVTGVMIENSMDARPQSGLSEAGVVFEAVAEGGVTRFLALFQDTAPDNIGPIRSARPYYVQWALGFDAAYGHVGGSPDALSDIANWGVHDMNQFSNGGSYHRTSDRPAPHNVYTSVSTLNALESAKGYTSTYAGFTRSIKDAPSAAPTATGLDFRLSGYTYDPHYDYVAATNSYDRSEAGQPHMDANGSKRISPKVVIAMITPLSQGALDSSGAYYSNYNVIGSGQAYIFQNGTLTIGNWTKSSNNANIAFTDAAGTPIPLNPGQTWISAVTGADKITSK